MVFINKLGIIIAYKDRIILLLGAGILTIGIFLPWVIMAGKPAVAGGPYRYEFPIPGYYTYPGIISFGVGFLVLLIATVRSRLDRLSGICLITLGTIAIYLTHSPLYSPYTSGNVDIFDLSMVPITLDGTGLNVTQLGAIIIIVGGLLTFITASRTQKNQPVSRSIFAAQQGQFTR